MAAAVITELYPGSDGVPDSRTPYSEGNAGSGLYSVSMI